MFSFTQPSIPLPLSPPVHDQGLGLVEERDHMQEGYVKSEVEKEEEMTIDESEVVMTDSTIGSGSRANFKNNFIIPPPDPIVDTSEVTLLHSISDSLSQSQSHTQSVGAFRMDHLNDMKSNSNFTHENDRSNIEIRG